MKRSAGVLMHVSSLPGEYSIGSFGKEAKAFIDLLADSGFGYWQVLPFGVTDEYHSPYKAYSAFAGNPYFIDLPTLAHDGLLSEDELLAARQETPYLCEFERLSRERLVLLRAAASRFSSWDAVGEFILANPAIEEFCRFMAIRDSQGDRPWSEWQDESYKEEDLRFWQFVQHTFFTQWQKIKSYANEKGVKLIGDIPIYLSYDSADVWAHRDLFLLDEAGRPECVAGVPPDYFSEEGQLWGNPLYHWARMRRDGYAFWCERLRHMLTLFDGVRIDHFRGLESYWSVPYGAKSAKEGQWKKGPGKALIRKLREVADGKLIIAEDLGDVDERVEALRSYSGFPGMKVLQFAFLGDVNSPHLPHNYSENCVAYSGTHDNNTLLGFMWEESEENRRRILSYCGFGGEDWNRGYDSILKTLWRSAAGLVIVPIQDLLGYGADTRMNTPGVAEGNWQYRVTSEQLAGLDREKLLAYNTVFGR